MTIMLQLFSPNNATNPNLFIYFFSYSQHAIFPVEFTCKLMFFVTSVTNSYNLPNFIEFSCSYRNLKIKDFG